MLDNIKLLLEIEGSELDHILSLYLKILIQKVKSYCNREDIPPELELIIVDIFVSQYKSRRFKTKSTEASGGKKIESIKRGGYSVTFSESTSDSSSSSAIGVDLLSYESLLDKFVIKENGANVVRFL